MARHCSNLLVEEEQCSPSTRQGAQDAIPSAPLIPTQARIIGATSPSRTNATLAIISPPPRQIWSYLDRLCRFFPALFAFQGLVPTSISNLLNFFDRSHTTPRHTPC